MFDFIANILTLVFTILLPLYLSHRALQQSQTPAAVLNPATVALLTPWVTYFACLTFLHTTAATFSLPSVIPFYAWLRLAAHVYLLVPYQHRGRPVQEPGATYLYNVCAAPFLAEHEAQIEHAIDEAHERLRSLPIVEWVRVKLLGRQPSPPRRSQAATSPQQSYAQTLLARFASLGATPASAPLGADVGSAGPASSSSYSAAAGEIYGLLSSALSAASSYSSTTAATGSSAQQEPSVPPPSLASSTAADTDRASYVFAQRERLRALLRAFDREYVASASTASSPATPEVATGVSTGMDRSADAAGVPPRKKAAPDAGADFEDVGYEDLKGKESVQGARASKGWGGWIWGGSGSAAAKSPTKAKGE